MAMTKRLVAARDTVAKVRAELDDLYDRGGRGPDVEGGLSAAAVARMEPAVLARLRAARGDRRGVGDAIGAAPPARPLRGRRTPLGRGTDGRQT